MPDLATLQSRLADAQAAHHRLQTGTQEESIALGDMLVRYTRADIGALRSYIAELEGDIAAAGGSGVGLRRRAITVRLHR